MTYLSGTMADIQLASYLFWIGMQIMVAVIGAVGGSAFSGVNVCVCVCVCAPITVSVCVTKWLVIVNGQVCIHVCVDYQDVSSCQGYSLINCYLQ